MWPSFCLGTVLLSETAGGVRACVCVCFQATCLCCVALGCCLARQVCWIFCLVFHPHRSVQETSVWLGSCCHCLQVSPFLPRKELDASAECQPEGLLDL